MHLKHQDGILSNLSPPHKRAQKKKQSQLPSVPTSHCFHTGNLQHWQVHVVVPQLRRKRTAENLKNDPLRKRKYASFPFPSILRFQILGFSGVIFLQKNS